MLFLGCTVRLLGGQSVVLVMTSSAIIGLGTALSFAAMPAMILAVTPTQHSSAAVGLNALSRSLGAAGASAVAGVVLAGLTVLVDGHAFPSRAAFDLLSMAAMAAVICAGAAVACVGPARPTIA